MSFQNLHPDGIKNQARKNGKQACHPNVSIVTYRSKKFSVIPVEFSLQRLIAPE